MNNEIIAGIFILLGQLILAIVSLAGVYYTRKKNITEEAKTTAETAKIYQEMATNCGEKLRKLEDETNRKILLLARELDKRNKLIREWRDGIDKLLKQIINHELIPDWYPTNNDDLVDIHIEELINNIKED